MSDKQRIALYGGTFDPVHRGHLEIARQVQQLFEIAKVVLIPAEVAPHKTGNKITPALHRYAMLALATQSDPDLTISTIELDTPEYRYTVDTVAHFQRTLDAELFFIMGADSWTEIKTWREWERLVTMVNHIVVTRPGYSLSNAPVAAERIVDLRSGSKPGEVADGPRVFITDVVWRDVSASDIRSKANQGRFEELRELVPETVIEYIRKYKLYQHSNEPRFYN